ncbi:MAG TPA: [protein-PII] uridylyltransferase [Candidatus Binatia bacterium]|nr:[protein-PII] uridylyltransferase [Candidatus Binatia bacterium]
MNLANPETALAFSVDEIAFPRVDGRLDDLGMVAKAVVQRARARLDAWNAAGASGAEVVSAFTEVMDRTVQFLHAAAVVDFARRNARANQKCAVLAQGGYGRAELNPFSDVDLLFLYQWKVSPFVESVAEKILYSLWDTGLQVGHALRSVPECARLAVRDFKVKTSLLDARFLCGDPELAADFDRVVETDIVRRHPERFLREAAKQTAERHAQYGSSVYLLEPHVKEGEGGLRDLHNSLWMARVKFKVRSLREIVQKGVVPESEIASVLESRDFLWKVRNTLHFATGGHQDQLTFEHQEHVAGVLGYRDADERRAVERFLQDYYLHAARVNRFGTLVTERCLESQSPYRRLGRIFSRRIGSGIRILGGEIAIDNPAILGDAASLVGVFLESQRHGVEIGSRARELLTRATALLERDRGVRAVVEPFLEVLRGRKRIYETLRAMHDVGALGALVPEFGQLRSMVIRDFYHIYTVDEHTLRGIMELERLGAGEHRQGCPLLTQVMHEIDRPEVLYLAMLLHDVGKGHGHGHSDRGARLAKQVAGRLGLEDDDVIQVERLVRHHLLMSHVAQHRDLYDDRVILDFARHVGSVETLKKLYVMTFADMRAVAPKVWNNWRDLLLGELYMRTLEYFETGEFFEEAREARVARLKERLRRALADREGGLREALDAVLATMPESYFLSTPEQSFPHHVELLREFREGGGALVSSIRHVPEREFSEFTVCAADRPGLFSMIAGVLAAHGMNILGAQITTSHDGVALDVFRLSHAESTERVLDEERWQRVRETLERVERGETSVEALVERSQRPTPLSRRPLPRIPTSVTFDLQDSDHYSLIEVSAQDQIGLLFVITNTLYRQRCLIHLAKISTVLHHVYDVFYVTDASGQKIEDWRRMQEICEVVRQRVEGSNG